MSLGDGAADPLGDGPMDPREFEKKTQDELDDILNRCDVLRLVRFSYEQGFANVFPRFPCMA